MKEGMSIKLHTQFGVIAILAGKGCERTFTWDNQSYTVELIPRLKRWYGKLGLYHPQMRPPHENVVHMIAEEYQVNFSSYAEFNEFKSLRNGVYNDQGLYVEFVKREGPGAEGNIFVMVTISQIKINGENPEKLMGSANGKLIIKNGT